MSDATIVRIQIDQKPSKKFFPKHSNLMTKEAAQKDIESLVVDMKAMLGADLVKQRGAV